jgi:cytoskeletal protein CcmA (bactofilin family)
MSSFFPDPGAVKAPAVRGTTGSGLLLAVAVLALGAQEAPPAAPTPPADLRGIVAKSVSVAEDESALRLETVGGDELELVFRDGQVRLDGRETGSYDPGGELDSAWRALLGQAVALEDGPLAEALVAWSPPASLDGSAARVAARIDDALEAALTGDPVVAAPAAPGTDDAVARLLARSGRLAELARALDGADLDEVMIRVDEDVRIDEEVELDATLLVVDGDAEVLGEVRGDVVVVGGRLELGDGSRIEGDVRLVDAEIVDRGGRIEGSLVDVGTSTEAAATTVRATEELREEIRAEIRNEIRSEMRQVERSRGPGIFQPLRNVGRGVGDIFSALLKLALFGLLAGAAVYFGQDQLEVISQSVRRGPVRAGTVGLAASFLVIPTWVLGIVALTITIIGIPVMLAWIPLFPLAVAIACGFGMTAVAGNVGDWVADQRISWLSWVRSSNPYTRVAGGLLVLGAPFVLAGVLEMGGGFLDLFQGALLAAGWVGVVLANLVGLGAVLLTRGGRRPEYYRADPLGDVGSWGPSGPSSEPGPGPYDDWFGGDPAAPGPSPASGAAPPEGAAATREGDASASESSGVPPEESTSGATADGDDAGGPEDAGGAHGAPPSPGEGQEPGSHDDPGESHDADRGAP